MDAAGRRMQAGMLVVQSSADPYINGVFGGGGGVRVWEGDVVGRGGGEDGAEVGGEGRGGGIVGPECEGATGYPNSSINQNVAIITKYDRETYRENAERTPK